MAIIELKKVGKTYDSGREELEILRDLDFSLHEGTIVSITGESGCGKSTLLNLIAGLDDVSSGEVWTCGHPVHKLKENELAEFRSHEVGLVFQFHFLMKELTALENVFLPAWMGGIEKKAAKEEAMSWLDKVGLENRSHSFPGQLSGGERQRVALARALMGRPKLILADEPTGNLDGENSRKVEDLLFNLVEESSTSLLLVTHDLELAARAPIHMKVRGKKLEKA